MIDIHVPPTQNKRAQEVPGAKYRAKKRCFDMPLSWAACVQLRGVFGDDLDVGPLLARWSIDEWEYRVRPALELRGGAVGR